MPGRLIVGCGYVGKRVAQRWIQNGDTVWAITRSLSKASELVHEGIRPIVWNWYDPASADVRSELQTCWQQITTILVSVSHASVDGIPPTETHQRGLAVLLELSSQWNRGDGVVEPCPLQWIYLSTTGVYGDEKGGWIDETSELSPKRPGSIAAANAERWLEQALPADSRLILRPAGIYGPDRVPNWQSIRDGVPMAMDPMSYLNLIHVEDLAHVVEHFSNRVPLHPLYCVSDNQPAQRCDYYQFIAELGNWPSPRFATTEDTVSRKPRSEGSKRVNATRLLEELPFSLQFPSFREGLEPLLRPFRSDGAVPT